METIRHADSYKIQALAAVIAGTPDGGEKVLGRAREAGDRAHCPAGTRRRGGVGVAQGGACRTPMTGAPGRHGRAALESRWR
jgi:hypothetical protein